MTGTTFDEVNKIKPARILRQNTSDDHFKLQISEDLVKSERGSSPCLTISHYMVVYQLRQEVDMRDITRGTTLDNTTLDGGPLHFENFFYRQRPVRSERHSSCYKRPRSIAAFGGGMCIGLCWLWSDRGTMGSKPTEKKADSDAVLYSTFISHDRTKVLRGFFIIGWTNLASLWQQRRLSAKRTGCGWPLATSLANWRLWSIRQLLRVPWSFYQKAVLVSSLIFVCWLVDDTSTWQPSSGQTADSRYPLTSCTSTVPKSWTTRFLLSIIARWKNNWLEKSLSISNFLEVLFEESSTHISLRGALGWTKN